MAWDSGLVVASTTLGGEGGGATGTRRVTQCGGWWLFGLKPVLGGAPGGVIGAVEEGVNVVRRWRVRKVIPGEEDE